MFSPYVLSMKYLILSDVCDTLIDLNSTYDYIKFLYKHSYWNKFFWFLLNNYFFKLFSFIILKLTKYDIHRRLTFIFFKNIKKNWLNDINQDFRNFYISKKTKILDRIIEHKDKWDKTILVSASINPPIDMLGNYLWIDYYSSKLEEKNWIYTGRIKIDLLWNKEHLLASNELDVSKYDKVVFYTDNLSDIWFIKAIQELAKSHKFCLIIKHEKIRNKRIKLLHAYNIKNYEFIY